METTRPAGRAGPDRAARQQWQWHPKPTGLRLGQMTRVCRPPPPHSINPVPQSINRDLGSCVRCAFWTSVLRGISGLANLRPVHPLQLLSGQPSGSRTESFQTFCSGLWGRRRPNPCNVRSTIREKPNHNPPVLQRRQEEEGGVGVGGGGGGERGG